MFQTDLIMGNSK